MHLMLY